MKHRRITQLCRDGKIRNAFKEGKLWFIPEDTPKPLDGRTKGAQLAEVSPNRKSLPVGISDFREAVSNYYYVDKTLMIRDFLDKIPKVSLFTRPRRFGKTLNMDMLRVFFEKTDEDTSVYFRSKQIWACGEKYTKHQGQYPVIFLSFKDVKFETWKETVENIAHILSNEYDRHKELLAMDDNCIPKAFWQATGSNDIIRQIVSKATPEIQENLQLLMQGESISTYIDTAVIYPEIQKNPLSIYSFLLR